jgi:hypothetical protein
MDEMMRGIRIGIQIRIKVMRILNTLSKQINFSKNLWKIYLITSWTDSGSPQKAGSGSALREKSDPEPEPHQIKIRFRIHIISDKSDPDPIRDADPQHCQI